MTKQWQDKVVVVAGGSNGLGLEIARAFSNRGARCVLLARDTERLERAVADIESTTSSTVTPYSVDVTDSASVKKVVSDIESEFGRIDAWVNACGRSIRKPVSDCVTNDYRDLMELNFFAAVECTMAALPSLENSGGHLINIGSLSSKTAWPFISPYAASKHALAAFTQQLRIEGPENVHVLHVCSGPIARSDSGTRYDQQTAELSESAQRPGAGAPVKLIDPQALAKRIIAACESRKPEIVTSFKSRILFAISQLWPSWGDRLIKRFSKK